MAIRTEAASLVDRLIAWSLTRQWLVIVGAIALVMAGLWVGRSAPVDVFPDLTAPTVTVLTEAPGLTTEEVERQVTAPIEALVAGADRVRRVRSQSVAGFSLVWVEFDWDAEVYRARQVVTERLTQLESLPVGVAPPQLGPITSIMGEILYLGLAAETPGMLMAAREAADWLLAPRLLSIPGVAQVVNLGGEVRQYQVLMDPERMLAAGIDILGLRHAVAAASRNASGDLVARGGQQLQLSFLGRVERLEELSEAVVGVRHGVPVRLRHVADIKVGPALPVGDGGVNAKPGVVIAVAKQPGADTLALTRDIYAALDALEPALPDGISLARELFRQATFIELAIDNVGRALRDGAVLVAVILFAFLLNLRTTLISVIVIPISLLAAVVVLTAMGATINTMTLGGMTIAIGALVDDAVIFVESIHRRLRENAKQSTPAPAREVVYAACREVSRPVVYSTVLILLVFLPLFFLDGIEGRLLQPLGIAYLVAIATSLLVALTLTPVLGERWLAGRGGHAISHEPVPVWWLRRRYRPVLEMALTHARKVSAVSLLLVIATMVALLQAGRTFLPDFNEGALTIEMLLPPGTALAESAERAAEVERRLAALPEVLSTARRTGRAQLDEHTQPPHMSEIDLRLGELRDRRRFEAALRGELESFPEAFFSIGQPISHRIDHMLSGVRANLAVKIVGPSLPELQRLGRDASTLMREVDGLVDVSVEPIAEVPQLRLRADRETLARHGLTVSDVADSIETAWRGSVVSQVFEGQRRFDLVLRLPDESRQDLARLAGLTLASPLGYPVPLSELVTPRLETTAATVLRENGTRRLVVSANITRRDMQGAVTDARRALTALELPPGYHLELGGQFEAESRATRTLATVTGFVLLAMAVLIFAALRSWWLALVVMLNVPLALVGGVLAVWLLGGVLSVAALVGLITLFGIAVRNGLLLVSRFQSLAAEGMPVHQVIVAGAEERLTPILMTALTAALALVPLALGIGQPGTEIQAPMAWVILGGLLSSTALNMVVVPAVCLLTAQRWRRPGRLPPPA